jgi:acetylornithine deacetylase/succinyl-diaminopimelate desuccinylase-like protein
VKPGDRVNHDAFGLGTVVATTGEGERTQATIAFGGDVGTKVLLHRGLLDADACVVGEPSGMALGLAQRGGAFFIVTAHGRAAHGSTPELGANAVEAIARLVLSLREALPAEATHPLVGRPTVTASVVEGGTAANVVAERCTVQCEARSIDHDRASEVATGIVDAMTEAASDRECDVEICVEELFRGYRVPRGSRAVEVASQALDAVGIEPRPIATGGGSDANAFHARGLECLNVANGTEAAHQPDERVSVHALETMLDVALGIVEHSAAA